MTIIEEENAVPGRREDVIRPDELTGFTRSSLGACTLAPVQPLPQLEDPDRAVLPALRRETPLSRRERRQRRRRPLVRAAWAALSIGLVVVVVAAATAELSAPGAPHTARQAAVIPAGAHAQSAAPVPSAPAPSPQQSATARALALLAGPPGPSWSVTRTFGPSSYTLTAVACPSGTQCVAVGETTFKTGMVLTSSDGGSTWSQHNVPAGVGTLAAVACPAANTCTAVGGTTAISTADGGATWNTATVGNVAFDAVSCPSTTQCVAGGSAPASGSTCPSGATYSTTDGGHTWADTPTPCFVPAGISCPSAADCVAVGSRAGAGVTTGEILRSADAGRTWQSGYQLARGGTQLSAVTCPTSQVCVAVGNAPTQAVLRSGDGGATWVRQLPHGPATRSWFLAVSCASEADCQAAGAGMPVSTADSGGSWSVRGSSNDITKILGISCPTATSCVGVAWDALAVPATIKLS